MPPILLPYQRKWAKDNSRVKICQKSRRIGLSWGDASIATLDASLANGCSTYYIGYNREMSEQYIEDVGWWAKSYQLVTSHIEKEILEQDDRSILVYRVRFASGHKVVALSSRPSNLRAKKGKVVIDEAAFHDDLPELLKAGMAILAWGGQLRIISTHNGIDNHFNQIIQQTLEGKFDYSIHKYDLDDAITDGLYQRICLVNGWQYSLEGQVKWRSQLIKDYGVGADEELFCIPADIKGGGKVFKKEWFQIIDEIPFKAHLYTYRFWDMAATAKKINVNAYYTASVKMGYDSGNYYILDARAEQLDPADSDDWMLEIALEDGIYTPIRWELEGGSAGIRVESHLKKLLWGFDAEGVKPQGDKVTRAKPFASDAKRGNVFLLKGHWNDRYINALYGFDGTPKPLTNDFTDATSGAWSSLQLNGIASILGT
jgi:predicted phage terminase large subunit-like protein